MSVTGCRVHRVFNTHQTTVYIPACVSSPPGAQRSWQQTANGHTHLSMSIFSPLFSCTFLCMNFTILRESHKLHYWPACCSLLSPSATLYHSSIKRLPKTHASESSQRDFPRLRFSRRCMRGPSHPHFCGIQSRWQRHY